VFRVFSGQIRFVFVLLERWNAAVRSSEANRRFLSRNFTAGFAESADAESNNQRAIDGLNLRVSELSAVEKVRKRATDFLNQNDTPFINVTFLTLRATAL
jgi:hypothetical protein